MAVRIRSISARWRIMVASAAVGALLCGTVALTVRSHSTAIRASARAHTEREATLATEQTVSAFWQEREAMSEFLAYPFPRLADAVRDKHRRFRHAFDSIGMDSHAESVYIANALASDDELASIFWNLPPQSGGVEDDRQARRLHAAEIAVLSPIARLNAMIRREYVEAERTTTSAERASFRSELATSVLGLLAIAAFATFTVRLVRRIDDQNVDLKRADLAKDEFIGTVSHELRTPLTSIHGYVELLLEPGADPLTAEQRGFLATVRRGSVRLDRLVDDLLLTSQIRAGHLDIRRMPIDLTEITRQSVESAQTHAAQNELQLSLTVPSGPVGIEGDDVRLAQAIDNVISNAIKFTPASGRVDVTLSEGGGRATLTVADTGMGMTADEIERLYERFYRSDSAQSKQIQGTGLGLPIVKAIVEAHGGTIAVTSTPEVGTSFAITLSAGASLAAAA